MQPGDKVTCVSVTQSERHARKLLTVGKVYEVLRYNPHYPCVTVRADDGKLHTYPAHRFERAKE